MTKRFWDKENNYSKGVLKEYTYWVLEVSYSQHTFGNYIVFCKREGVEKISELTDKELIELRKVFKEIETTLLKNDTFKPIHFNYWQMGNGTHQLHIHGIPRYNCEKTFLGKKWIDKDFKVPPIWTYDKQTDETVMRLKQEIEKFLL